MSCPVRRPYSKGEFRSIIGSSIIGIWAFFREMGLMREIGTYRIFYNVVVEDGQYMCKGRTTPPRWFKCMRPEHPAHMGAMLCTVQCRPPSACASKNPPRVHSKERRQDKTSGDLPPALPLASSCFCNIYFSFFFFRQNLRSVIPE